SYKVHEIINGDIIDITRVMNGSLVVKEETPPEDSMLSSLPSILNAKLFPLDDYTSNTWGILFVDGYNSTYFTIIQENSTTKKPIRLNFDADLDNFDCIASKTLDNYYCLCTTIGDQQLMWIKFHAITNKHKTSAIDSF